MRALLDVNFLVALLDSGHEHHEAARDWLTRNFLEGWATCPLSENGCIRVLSTAAYSNGACKPSEAMNLLEGLIGLGGHEFWPDDFSLLDTGAVERRHIQGPKQLTDIYLLTLATRRGGSSGDF